MKRKILSGLVVLTMLLAMSVSALAGSFSHTTNGKTFSGSLTGSNTGSIKAKTTINYTGAGGVSLTVKYHQLSNPDNQKSYSGSSGGQTGGTVTYNVPSGYYAHRHESYHTASGFSSVTLTTLN